ncbi:MAG: CDIF630_02480 family spore surface protein [Paraclostridium sp.]
MKNEKKCSALSGKNNKRLKSNRPIASASTAAWSGTKDLKKESNVSIPPLKNVEDAKDWVDNGSRL